MNLRADHRVVVRSDNALHGPEDSFRMKLSSKSVNPCPRKCFHNHIGVVVRDEYRKASAKKTGQGNGEFLEGRKQVTMLTLKCTMLSVGTATSVGASMGMPT